MRRVLSFPSASVLRARLTQVLIVVGLALISTAPAWSASMTSMPWDDPLSKVVSSLTGPFAKVVATVAILILGVGIAFSEGGSMMRKALWVILGVAITFGVSTIMTNVFTFTGGLLV